MKATGKPHSLWVFFAKFYEENEQLDDVSHYLNFNLPVSDYFLSLLLLLLVPCVY